MRAPIRTWTLSVMLAAAATLPSAALADGAPSHPIVCMTAPTGSLAGPATPTALPPLTLGPAKSAAAAGPTTTVPPVILLSPQPQTGAYVVPTLTTLPSLPGVTIATPQIVVPPLPAPGQNRAVAATGALQRTVGPSAAATSVCY